MACQLFGAQSIPKPMMVHFHFGPFGKKFHWGLEQKYMRFLWWKCLFITETAVFYSDFKFKQFDRVVCKMTAIMFMFQCVYERKGAVPWEGPDFVVQGARRLSSYSLGWYRLRNEIPLNMSSGLRHKREWKMFTISGFMFARCTCTGHWVVKQRTIAFMMTGNGVDFTLCWYFVPGTLYGGDMILSSTSSRVNALLRANIFMRWDLFSPRTPESQAFIWSSEKICNCVMANTNTVKSLI